ncbi:YwqG family protein [Streptomyces roseoverticillatus]|uniref:YwqG family protein n=1 Tax=Streptomyces roseoverticillatus TaxID=66429 RepID=UPI003F540A54
MVLGETERLAVQGQAQGLAGEIRADGPISALDELPAGSTSEPVVVQPFTPNSGWDHKLWVVADQVFAALRPSILSADARNATTSLVVDALPGRGDGKAASGADPLSVASCIIIGMTQSTTDALHTLAREHLPTEIAERWIGLMRPGLRLEKATSTGAVGEPVVVGRLGGLPELPEDEEWPVWEAQGPLSFIASIDCAALPSTALDITLPSDGTLAFFYFDGQVDDGCAMVSPYEPGTWAGARVLYVPAGSPVTRRTAPEGIQPYPEVMLTARVETTAPYLWHPAVYREFAPMPDDHPLWDDEFQEALWDLSEGTEHRIGGHANPVQDEVESEVARGSLGNPPWADPRINEEALRWVLLAQFDTDDDADMMWGDCGVLYWLIRPEDLAARRFDRAMFTWQCG